MFSSFPPIFEKTFDQIDKAVSYITEKGTFPVIVGGDHSIGYPNSGGWPSITTEILASFILIGISIFKKRIWMSACTPLTTTMRPIFRTYDPKLGPNRYWWLVRLTSRTQSSQRRGTTVMTMGDLENIGIDRAVEAALEIAWKGCKAVYLSFDIDVVDGGIAPGTGSPEPGGLIPREALRALRQVAAEGIIGMEVVEISPPYDTSESTAQLGCRAILDVLGTMVATNQIGSRSAKGKRPGTQGLHNSEAPGVWGQEDILNPDVARRG